MSRPYYEDEATLAAEEATMQRLAHVVGIEQFQKLGIKYGVDYALLTETGKPHPRFKVAAWVECKRRNYSRTHFSTFMLSLHKWMQGRELAAQSGQPFIIAVEWNDGLYTVNASKVVNAGAFFVGIGGRGDRDDAQDMEPCVFIPVDQFTRAE